MTIDPAQRAYRLVEELRAEVDFEIDDVISEIVRNLPEEYFVILSRDDQLTHLKALLAISICHLKDEITLRSGNSRHVAVVARQNYSGMLAKIIEGLPTDYPLIGAKIFTSKTHDFIIDLFDFNVQDTEANHQRLTKLELVDLVDEVTKQTGASREMVAEFVEAYPTGNQTPESAGEIAEHFRTFEESQRTRQIVVHWSPGDSTTRITVGADSIPARDLFLGTARALSNLHADIDQAFLSDFPRNNQEGHIAIASFVATGDFSMSNEPYVQYLKECLGG